VTEAAIPEGAVLVHIGPPKTGTTTLQSAMHQHRKELRQHGVLYPGRTQRHKRPSFALLGMPDHDGLEVPMAEWDELVDAVRAAPDLRVCVSSESFARAGRGQRRTIVEGFGSERVHMVMTARRLDRLLPSAWQQRVKGVAETLPYGEWLAEVLGPESADTGPRSTFWKHHDLAATLAAWSKLLPPERIIVVVADESDRGQLLRVFEELLALPSGILVPQRGEGSAHNTSLSHTRAELLRGVNVAVAELEPAVRRRVLADVQRALLVTPREDAEQSIPTLPQWAAERVADYCATEVELLEQTDVRVIGDPSHLRFAPHDHPAALPEDPRQVPQSVAVASILAAATSQPRQRAKGGGGGSVPSEGAGAPERSGPGPVRRRRGRGGRPGRRKGDGATG
jgi:hypothetical protein